jgi:hypothetical protein
MQGRQQLHCMEDWHSDLTGEGVVADVKVAQRGVQVLAIRNGFKCEFVQAAAERVVVNVQDD